MLIKKIFAAEVKFSMQNIILKMLNLIYVALIIIELSFVHFLLHAIFYIELCKKYTHYAKSFFKYLNIDKTCNFK